MHFLKYDFKKQAKTFHFPDALSAETKLRVTKKKLTFVRLFICDPRGFKLEPDCREYKEVCSIKFSINRKPTNEDGLLLVSLNIITIWNPDLVARREVLFLAEVQNPGFFCILPSGIVDHKPTPHYYG